MHSSFEMIGVTASCQVSPVASLLRRQVFPSTHRLAIWRAAESTSLSRSRQSSRGKRQENATLPPLPGDSTSAFTRGFADSSSTLEKAQPAHWSFTTRYRLKPKHVTRELQCLILRQLVKVPSCDSASCCPMQIPGIKAPIVGNQFFACDLTDPERVHRGFLAATAA
jgi:hypothetical protein